VASNGSLTTNEDTAATGTLAETDVDNSTLTYSVVAGASHGTVTITNASTGAYSYTPDANYNGTASFSFEASDGSLDSNTATVSVTFTAVNDAPSFTKGADQTALDDAGTVTVADRATAISDRDPEVIRTLTFVVSNDNNAVRHPAVDQPRRHADLRAECHHLRQRQRDRDGVCDGRRRHRQRRRRRQRHSELHDHRQPRRHRGDARQRQLQRRRGRHPHRRRPDQRHRRPEHRPSSSRPSARPAAC
jgi:VCBS repeat-containing protein